MTADAKAPVETARTTVPQHVLNRFEAEWQQMRVAPSATPKYFQGASDKD